MAGIFNRVGSGLGLLMSGPNDPMLGERENAMARRFGIMQTGLGMLGAPTGTPTLQSLAQASLFGQQQGQGYRGQALQIQQGQAQAQARKQLAEQIGKAQTPDQIAQIFQFAIGSGDVNLANAAIGWAKAMQKDPQEPFKQVAGGMVLVDPNDPTKILADFRKEPVALPPVYGTEEWYTAKERELALEKKYRSPSGAIPRPQAYVDPDSGEMRFGIWNPGTQMFDPVEGAIPTTGVTDQTRMARALSPLMDDAYTRVRAMDTPSLYEKIAAKPGLFGAGNYFNTPEGRQFRQASLQFLSAALSIISGKTVTEQEVERNEQVYIPQPGDDEVTIKNKMNTMKIFSQSAHQLGGLRQPQGTAGPPELDWRARAKQLRGGG